MGLIFGKIGVETKKYEVIKSTQDYEIRKYTPSVVAEVTYDPSQFKGNKDGGFMVLVNYIGAFGNPQNTKPEKIAMTAPVITKETGRQDPGHQDLNPSGSSSSSEKIAMTAPVITKETSSQDPGHRDQDLDARGSSLSEKIAMTAPVVTKEGGKMVTMQFTLPNSYRKVDEAPKPIDERVVIRKEGERTYGVVKFGGAATDEVVKEKVKRLSMSLEKDGFKIVGDFLLGRYNPPWRTIAAFRTSEVLIPVE